MLGIYDKIVDADLVIWASPIFCWGVSSQTKAMLDRCFALLTGESLLKDSKWALVLTAGGDHYDGADLAVQAFRRLTRFAGVKYLGQHVVANCPDERKLRKNKTLEQQAREFGRELAKALKA
jgi:multimeric flavodoxin WrbA